MHEAHIFHRDIKPENILMDGDTPKIIDLGIARMLGSHEQASTTRGTLYYMSPEILFDDGASFPSDIWSVGITVYEMTTGKLPFYHKSNGKTIDAIRNGKFTLPHEIRPEIPKGLSNIIKRALAKDINQRYQSSQQMLHDLVSLEKGDSSVIEKELAEVNKYRNSLEKAAMVESKLRAIMAKYPNEPRAYQYLGEFLSHGMRCAEAITVFKHGLERDTENAILHWDLAMAYLKVNKPKEVASCLEKAMSLDLDEIRKRHSATLLKRLRESKSIADSKTEEELISTIESLPLLEQKNVKAAETKLRKLVEKYPTEARTYQALGEFFNRCQRHKEAIEVFKRALKLDDKNGLIRWNLAMAYMGKGHRKKASESLKSALELGLDEGHHHHASNLLKIIERSKA
jgi:predicted Zn-dependent protease